MIRAENLMMTILLMPLFLESIIWSFDVVLTSEPLDKILTYDHKNQSPQLHIYKVHVICSSVFLTFSSRTFLEFCGGVRLSVSSSYTNHMT